MAAGSRKGVWIGAGVAALVAVGLYLQFDFGRVLTLDNFKASRDALVGAYQFRPLQSLLTFFGVYVLATALSIPGALIQARGFDPAEHERIRGGKAEVAFLDYDWTLNDAEGEGR